MTGHDDGAGAIEPGGSGAEPLEDEDPRRTGPDRSRSPDGPQPTAP
ncbi:hypothetical protein ACFUN7_13430 [Streptomyces sp. NPDC057236]